MNSQSQKTLELSQKQKNAASGITLEQILSSQEAMDQFIEHLFTEYVR